MISETEVRIDKGKSLQEKSTRETTPRKKKVLRKKVRLTLSTTPSTKKESKFYDLPFFSFINSHLSILQPYLWSQSWPLQLLLAPGHLVARVQRIERPVAALAGVLPRPRQLQEALVEGEVVPDGILPARIGQTPVVNKFILNKKKSFLIIFWLSVFKWSC